MGDIIVFNKFYKRKGGSDMCSEITVERKKEIETIVTELLKNVDFTKSPYVDIVKLVEGKGFSVETSDMDIETTGFLYADSENKIKRITVNKKFKNPDGEEDVIFKKSRFITAHEYGHYILHRKEGQMVVLYRDTYHRSEPDELEADYFARSILMPLTQFQLFYEIAQELGKGDEEFVTNLLSLAFKVTRNKVNRRINDLKELKLA